MNSIVSQRAAEHLADPCFHCGLGLGHAPLAIDTDHGSEWVCCHGCAAAVTFIREAGLTRYYDVRESATHVPAETVRPDDAAFDAPALLDALATPNADGTVCLHLSVPNADCAACAWLLETAFRRDAKVELQLDLGNRTAAVTFHPQRVKLSRLLRLARQLGYPAAPVGSPAAASLAELTHKKQLVALGVSGLGAMQVMMFAVARYFDLDAAIGTGQWQLMVAAEWLITSFVLVFAGQRFLAPAYFALRRRAFRLDLPLALGISLAYVSSSIAVVRGGDVYFDAVTMLIFLILLTRYWEAMQTRTRLTRSDIPATANVLSEPEFSAHLQAAPTQLLVPGQFLLVRAGEVCPVDGIVQDGDSDADEAHLTGESRRVPKHSGDRVWAGTMNCTSSLIVRVDTYAARSRLAGIDQAAQRLHQQRAHWRGMADRLAPVFTLMVLGSAGSAFVIWQILDSTRALPVTLSVLVITCPCALAIATPLVYAMANRRLAALGAMCLDSAALDRLPSVTDVVFDKTGTLTRGESLSCTTLADVDAAQCTDIASLLERASHHPLARLFTARALRAEVSAVEVARWGVRANLDGTPWAIGSATFAIDGTLPTACSAEPNRRNSKQIWLSRAGRPIARFDLLEHVHSTAVAAVADLKRRGLRVHLLSGDGPAHVTHIARQLGIGSVHSEQSPEQKLEFVTALKAAGARVMMVGDGSNDALAMAAADVGVSVHTATDLNRSSAHVRLLRDDLTVLGTLLLLASRSRTLLRQNLGWALAYNVAAIPLAVCGLVTPLVAAVGMGASSLAVAVNATRIGRAR